jgi:hypothetical protein
MKQIIITIIMLSIALVLIIGVIIPIFEHGAYTGNTAVLKGQAAITKIGRVIQ